MEGYTIKEIAEILKISPAAAKLRLFTAGIKPKTKDAIYDYSVIEAIREVSKGGRPRKDAQENPEK
ncbi:hypothetical protein AGMMS49944_09640 [Spirochaetia bacterium]|nr:hypothetical protein AGMMS49944_09640 [Spirochaetia bacterium]